MSKLKQVVYENGTVSFEYANGRIEIVSVGMTFVTVLAESLTKEEWTALRVAIKHPGVWLTIVEVDDDRRSVR